MKNLKITIEFEVKGDLDDEDTLKEDIYNTLQEMMESDQLSYEAEEDEEDDDY